MAAKRGNKLTNSGRTNQRRTDQRRADQGGPNQSNSGQGRSDRPRGFPPSPRDSASQGDDPRNLEPSRNLDAQRNLDPRGDLPAAGPTHYGELSEHPAFNRPEAPLEAPREAPLEAPREAPPWSTQPTSSGEMPPPAGYSGANYIPPGPPHDDAYRGGQPFQQSMNPQSVSPQSVNPQSVNPQNERTDEQWRADAKYAPPGLQQPLESPQPYGQNHGAGSNQLGHHQPGRLPDGRLSDAPPTAGSPLALSGAQPGQPYGATSRPTDGTPAYGAPQPGAARPYSASSHALQPHAPQPYAPQPYSPGHVSAGYGDRAPHPHSTTAEPPRQGSSVGKTILKVLGWTILLSAILMALVVGGGWFSLRGMANNILNPSTQATIITKAPVVASLKKVNKQIMIEHDNMVDVDYQEAPEGWLAMLPIEQRSVVLLRGRVPAGFDLSELGEDDVWISNDGSKIQLVLPPPVVFEDNVSVNFDESRVISEGDTCPNFICAGDIDAIQQTIIPQGRQLLIETSRKSGIMEQAAEMGIAYYESLLRSLGFEDIQVLIRSDLDIQQTTE